MIIKDQVVLKIITK